MNIDLSKLNYSFQSRPLLIGGMAKEYYGVRKSAADVDLVVTAIDYELLAKQYPDNTEDLFGDLGVKIHGFEIWKTICLFNYDFLCEKAEEKDEYKIISFEKLLFLTALAAQKNEKYKKDLQSIVEKILELQYKK